MKTCTKCSQNKELNNFYKSSSGKGLRATCKDCHSCLSKVYNKNSKEIRNSKSKEWYQANRTKKDEKTKEWYRLHPEARNFKSANYRARKLQATPSWLTEDQKLHIKHYYELSSLLSEQLEPMAVDHVIPLKGKDVCGLHVPWNLQITTISDNSKKRNKVA